MNNNIYKERESGVFGYEYIIHGKMSYNLYKEMEKERGEFAEYGNIELSYDYLMKIVTERKKDPNSIRLLDVGTNIGTLPNMVFDRAHMNMYGAEMRGDAIEKGKRIYPAIKDKLLTVGSNLDCFEDESFDVITMFDVIEHIPNVDVYLKNNIFRILKSGGLFIFQTPNARINPFFEIVRTKSLTDYKSYHCSLQTPKGLNNMLLEVGFNNVVIEKNSIDSEFNRKKLRRYFGPIGIVALKVFNVVPLCVYPNLWGYCEKE